jgi:aerobic carbon-monoxide dehydrogenase large subunit
VRVIAPDVGGGLGQKVETWPQDVALSYLTMASGRPIKWIEERWENLLAYHGHGYAAEVEAAVKREGAILGMRFRIVADVGAYFLTATAGCFTWLLGGLWLMRATPYAPILAPETF